MRSMYIKYFLLFLLFFVITLFISWFFYGLYCDELWLYGFSYNISVGMTPYKDFNMIVPSLYSLLGSVFLNIFGTSLFSFELFNAFITAIVMLFLFISLGKISLIIFPILLCYMLPNYNYLCLLFLIIIILINDKVKDLYKYYLFGFLIGLIFCTKHSIGICCFIVMILFSKEKKRVLLGFIFTICLLLLYLVYNNCLIEFFDYVFGSMFFYGEKNSAITVYILFLIIILIYLVLNIFKTKFKDYSLLLILAFQSVAIPIFDKKHIMFGMIVCLFYLLIRKKEYFKSFFKYYFVITITLLISILSLPKYNYYLYKDKNSFLYGKAIYSTDYFKAINDLKSKVSIYLDDYNYFFIYSYRYFDFAYAVKLDMNVPISKFDLINNGNFGYNGVDKYLNDLEDICSTNSCLFFIDMGAKKHYSQTNIELLNFGSKYDLIDKVDCGIIEKDWEYLSFNIYSNINYVGDSNE